MRNVSRLLVLVVLLLLPALVLPAGGAIESRIKGKLPPLEGVFEKLFASSIRLMSMDQLQKEYNSFNDEDRTSLVNFLGKDRFDKALQGLEEPKKKFLEDSYLKFLGKGDSSEFARKHLPIILAANANVMSAAQVKQSLAVLDDMEMGSLTLSMGPPGTKIMFGKITGKDKHNAIMESTPMWVILEMGLIKYGTVRDYTCTLLKQERIDNKLQGVETMEVKYRVKPSLAIYAKWVNGPYTGRECLYNETVIGKDKLRVREGGMLGLVAVTLPLDSAIAKRGTNHILTELGFGHLLNLSLKDLKASMPYGDMSRKDNGLQMLDGKSVFVMDSILRKNPNYKYYCHRLRSYIDYTNSLQLKAEIFDWNDQMFESYTYLKPRFNVRLKDIDFDPSNPAYKL
jgi:hypothetical protein